MITLPGEVDGHRVRVGCDVVAIEDVQDSLAAFGDRYLRKVFTASEINDCQGRNRVHRLAGRFAAKEVRRLQRWWGTGRTAQRVWRSLRSSIPFRPRCARFLAWMHWRIWLWSCSIARVGQCGPG